MYVIEVQVNGQLPPLKGEARSMLSQGHGQAPRVQALLRAAHAAKGEQGFRGFGASRIGMELVVRPVGAAVGDATNALGGVGDTLQSRRVNIDVGYLGELAEAGLFDDDAQIRRVVYREEPGQLGYTVRFWALEHYAEVPDPTAWLGDPIVMLDNDDGRSINVHVPPATRDRVAVSILDAPSPYDGPSPAVGAYACLAKLTLRTAKALRQALGAAISQLEEHAEPNG